MLRLGDLVVLVGDLNAEPAGAGARRIKPALHRALGDGLLPIHTHGGTARLPRSAENRGSKTVSQVADERVGEFQVRLVIRTPGTEYYLMIDKADRNSQVFFDRIFFRRFFPIGFFGPANQSG